MKNLIGYVPENTFSGFIYDNQGNIQNVISYEMSSQYNYKHPVYLAFDYSNTGLPAATQSDNKKWINFSLNSGVFLITHYELHQRVDTEVHFMKEWMFSASNDGNNWMTLDRKKTDSSFDKLGGTKLCSCKKGIFQSFSLKEIEQYILTVHRIEIYGFYCMKRTLCDKILLSFFSQIRKMHLSISPTFIYLFMI